MDGATIVTKFQNMVDDVLDEDFTYQLMNDAKNEIEAERLWAQLKSSQNYTVPSGYDYDTALGSLPTDFAIDDKIVEDDGYTRYDKVAFGDLYEQKTQAYGYYLDMANNNLHLTGENHAAKTIVLYYGQFSDDITSTTEWVFPSRFHMILPLKMAKLYYPSDAGEKARAWDDRWDDEYNRISKLMFLWDDSLKARNFRGRSRVNQDNPKGLNL